MPTSIKLCKAVIGLSPGSETVFFRSNVNMYKDGFGTAVGITVATADETAKSPVSSIRQLIRVGYLRRMTATLKGTATEPGTSVRILVAAGREPAARTYGAAGTNPLPGVKGGAIASIRESNRMRLL